MISTPPVAQARVEVEQLVPRRLVPVGVEAQQGELRGRRGGDRLLDRAADEVEALLGVAGREQRLAHAVLVEDARSPKTSSHGRSPCSLAASHSSSAGGSTGEMSCSVGSVMPSNVS